MTAEKRYKQYYKDNGPDHPEPGKAAATATGFCNVYIHIGVPAGLCYCNCT